MTQNAADYNLHASKKCGPDGGFITDSHIWIGKGNLCQCGKFDNSILDEDNMPTLVKKNARQSTF